MECKNSEATKRSDFSSSFFKYKSFITNLLHNTEFKNIFLSFNQLYCQIILKYFLFNLRITIKTMNILNIVYIKDI